MTLLEQCQLWHEKEEYGKIVEALEALSPEQRTPETDSELARAYNNLAEPKDRELFQKALALLKPHEAYYEGDHLWNFRVAYAHYYLDQEGPALRHFEQALAARPGDEDTMQLIEDCRARLTLPRFAKSFRERRAEAWAAFEKEEEGLRRLIDRKDRDAIGQELIEKCSRILNLAIEDVSFEMGFDGEKYELILTPEGEKAKLFEIVYFQSQAPASLWERWNIWAGRQPAASFALRIDQWQVSAVDVQVRAELQKEKQIGLTLYCEKLLPLLRENENQAWWMLSTMTDQVLGEIPAMSLINDFQVAEEPIDGESGSLAELPHRLEEMGLELSLDAQAYLDNSYTAYEPEPVGDPDADWRQDVYIGVTRCVPLIRAYLANEEEIMDEFHRNGAAPGFFCYPLDGFEGETRSADILAFREMLEEAVRDRAGGEAVTFIGGATGLTCGYLDFIAWDLRAVLEAAADFFRASTLPWANFHTFRRDAGTIALLDRSRGADDEEKEDGEKPAEPSADGEAGLLSPSDIRKLESFVEESSGYYWQMLAHIESFIRNGIGSGRFTEEQARQDLELSLWYGFACLNLDDYEYYWRAAQWMSGAESRAAGCGVWYYRYSVALMYCGRLEEALRYAEAGIREEPDYPWTRLQAGKLRNHFGDMAGAFQAVEEGLRLEPKDYEFLTLKKEILAGASLEQMMCHWIDPSQDRDLQAGLDEDADEKQRAISCIVEDPEGAARFRALFAPAAEELQEDGPCRCFRYPFPAGEALMVFHMNEAGLSKLKLDWLAGRKKLLAGDWSSYAGENGETGALETVHIYLDYSMKLMYRLPGEGRTVAVRAEREGEREELPSENDERGEEAEGGPFVGFALLSEAEWDPEQLIKDLREQWDVEISEADDGNKDGGDGDGSEADDSGAALIFSACGYTVAVSLLASPIPHGEAEENAGNNYMWPEAVETAAAHRGQLIVAVLGQDEDTMDRGKLFVKVLACCCRQKTVTGIYASGTVFEPRIYAEFAEIMKEDGIPLLNLVWFGLYRDEDGINGYTYGLRKFGKDELEVLAADAEPGEVREFLINLAGYVLEYDVTLRDGETIGSTADDKHLIRRSRGVALPGMTLKVGFEQTEAGDYPEPGSPIMDNGRWHLESIREKELPVGEITAWNHMAIYLRWCMEHDLMSEGFALEHGETVRQVKDDPVHTDLRIFIRDRLEGKLLREIFNEEGEAFSRYYYYGEEAGPDFPRDIDDYALKYFGPERYHSDEFREEAYLFIPFDEAYYRAMAETLQKRWDLWRKQAAEQEEGQRPSALAVAMMNYLRCECQYFPPMADDDPITAELGYARRLGVREGTIPVLVAVDETLWECLILNSDQESGGAEGYAFNPQAVMEYRERLLSLPVQGGEAILEEMLEERREEALDDELDWEKEVLGAVEGGLRRDRFSGYWNYQTRKTNPLILAHIPVAHPWQVFAYLPFGGWNECPGTEALMAVSRYWYERYGALPVVMTHDELEFAVPRPVPEEAAFPLAEEQYGFCPDVVDQGEEEGTVGTLADSLRQSTVWYFWWD